MKSQSAEKYGIRQDVHYHQDNDPKLTSVIVQTWLKWMILSSFNGTTDPVTRY